MKIGYSYWGFCEEYNDSLTIDTPDGGRFCRPIFVKEAFKRGDEVIALQKQREDKPIEGLVFNKEFPKIDVLFIEWRWATWKNEGDDPKEPDLKRQWELIEHYGKEGIPIIIWECDAKMELEDIVKIKGISNNAIFTMSSLEDFNLFGEIFISMPYFMDYDECNKEIIGKVPDLVYVGNNYERESQFEKYYYFPSKLYMKHAQGAHKVARVYGNWLQPSPERVSPEITMAMYEDSVYFASNKVCFRETLEILSRSFTTVHILKEEYCKRKMITSRFFEAMYCNLLAFTPEEFVPVFGENYITKGRHDTFKILKDFFDAVLENKDINIYRRAVNLQKKIIENRYPETSIRNWYDKFVKLVKGERP